jgi:proton-translocating NADH-quinone oxidoreductase chain N
LNLGETLQMLSPELILLVTGLIVLILDLIWRDDGRKLSWLQALALAGLLGALTATFLLWNTPETDVLATLALDPFALFFKVIVLGTVGLVVLASGQFLKERTPYRGEFIALLVFAGLAASLAAASINLIMVYLSMEFLSITSYVLAGWLRDDRRSPEAGLKYFLYGAIASAAMLYGMSLLFGATGTTDMASIAQALLAGDSSQSWLAVPAIILLLTGFSFKIVLAPFHQWAPDTYEGAPTPITAFLSVGSKAAGLAILIRVFLTALPQFRPLVGAPGAPTLGWVNFLTALSIISMTLGNLIALRQTDIKRMLAYSSIAQAGYIIIGVICLTSSTDTVFNGLNGALLYLLAYLFTNIGAFVAVLAVENATGSTEIEEYAGLVRRAPGLALVLLICLLSLVGIPGTGGFLGKFLVFGAAIKISFYLIAVVGIVNSVIAAFYYMNVVRQVFFAPGDEAAPVIAVPANIKTALAIAAGMTILVGVYPQPFLEAANRSVQMLAGLF